MRYTDEEVIFKYIDNNLALVKTANDLGMSHNTIRKILLKHDIEIRDQGKKLGDITEPKFDGRYRVGDKKDKLTILMKKTDGDYVDILDELFVECECGVMTKMMYNEFIDSTCCGCDNNG
jgi:hypothetical protein